MTRTAPPADPAATAALAQSSPDPAGTVPAATVPNDGRPPQRPANQREPTSAERAAARAAELMESGTLEMDADDRFYFDPTDVPDGWTYEWKRRTVLNQEDPAYQVELQRMGWEPVPAKRHKELMPLGHKGNTIERDGMILMERPAIVTKRAQDRDQRNARELVQVSERKLEQAGDGQFERATKDGSLVKITKVMEPIDIPEE